MYKVYNVLLGDTIDKIASLFGIDVDALKILNGMMSDEVQEGMQLVVPNNNGEYIKYIVKADDNIYAIAGKYNMNYNDLLLLNGLEEEDFIYPGEEILIPKTDIQEYIIQEGDTINSVLNKVDISFENMIDNNEEIFLLPNQIIYYKKDN